MGFVKAWSANGREHFVPEHWFDNPVLSRGLTRDAPEGSEPTTPAGATGSVNPSRDDKSWTINRLRSYAEENSIDLGDASKRDEIFDVIESVEESRKPDNPATNAIGVAHGGPGGETATQDVDASDQVTTPTTTPATA